jgi:hypothetical protein
MVGVATVITGVTVKLAVATALSLSPVADAFAFTVAELVKVKGAM